MKKLAHSLFVLFILLFVLSSWQFSFSKDSALDFQRLENQVLENQEDDEILSEEDLQDVLQTSSTLTDEPKISSKVRSCS